jgi:ubiquinone/menaquinone biosynthesis C-methylase UbiE
MDARLHKRVQRYGWDLAAPSYEPLWRTQLAGAQVLLLDRAAFAPGERVLDVACGTGIVTFAAARAVGPRGEVFGVDLSGQMVEACKRRADVRQVFNTRFARMDAEKLDFTDGRFDIALCSLGLMYMPDPERALREMRRCLRAGGRLAVAVWGEAALCGWSTLFPIVDAEVESDVCPLFFRLGQGNTLARACADAGFERVQLHRIAATINYAGEDEACDAAFVGGPVALAWSRFEPDVRERVRRRYLESIAPWRHGRGYRIPGEFVVASGTATGNVQPIAVPNPYLESVP